MIKVNVDATLMGRGFAWLGAVAHDHEGRLLWAVVRRFKAG